MGRKTGFSISKSGTYSFLGKSASLTLALFLLVSPLAPVFAQESSQVSKPEGIEDVSSESGERASSEDIASTQPVDDKQVLGGEDEFEDAQAMSSQVGVDSEGNLTDMVTVDRNGINAVKVDKNTGDLRYTYPLVLPPGRGMTSPQLSLSYSAQNASDRDILGYGWSLSIPYIERLNKTGSESMYDATTSYYVSSLSGDLATTSSSTVFRSEVEYGDFLSYEKLGDTWKVKDKSGLTYYFGTATSSRQDNPANTTQIARWMLDKVEDPNGNSTTYTYSKSSGMIYPSQITYTSTSTQEGIFRVQFTSTSTDPHVFYNTGFSVTKDKIISTISVKVNDQEVRRYTLRYGGGLNGERDLLLGVTESGVAGGSLTSLPETTFDYDAMQLPTWTTDTSVNFPEPLSDTDTGVRFGDLNGDGLTDMIRYERRFDDDGIEYDYTIRRVHINNGDGTWNIDVSWDWDDIGIPFHLFEDGMLSGGPHWDFGSKLIDVNGDGRDDFVAAYEGWPSSQVGVYLNTGEGFEKATSTWTGLEPFVGEDFNNEAREFVDVNGDGLPDLVTAYFSSYDNGSPHANTYSSVKLNNGHGWVESSWTFPAPLGYRASTVTGHRAFGDVGTRFADVNGDGLVDVLRGYEADSSTSDPEKDEQTVYLNTGSGWASSTAWVPPVFINPDYPSISRGQHIVDINGDRLPDIVHAYCYNSCSYDFFLNTGNGWTGINYELPFDLDQGYPSRSSGRAFVDFDGDTIVDAWSLAYDLSTTTQVSGGDAYINNAAIPDLLTGINTDKGGHISIGLDGYLDTRQQDYAALGSSVVNPVVVSSVRYDSGFDDTWKTDYAYSQGDFYFDEQDFRDRRFAGFGTIVTDGGLEKDTTYFHQGNGNTASSSESGDGEEKIGSLYRSVLADPWGDVYMVTVNNWATTTNTNSTFVKLDSSLTLDYDGDSDHKDTAVSYIYDDTYGNLSLMTEWGEVAGSLDGTFTDLESDKRTTSYEYATNTAAYIVGLPKTELVRNNAGQMIKRSRFYYDNQSLGNVLKGNRTRHRQWVVGSTNLDDEWTYNAYGLVTQWKDPRDATTTYAYDVANLYPATTTNSLSHVTAQSYDYSSGKVTEVIDPNGRIHRTIYDALNRVRTVFEPDPVTGIPATTTTYTYTDSDTPGDTRVRETKYLDDALTNSTYTYFDGLGRKLQERKRAESSYAVRDWKYNDAGLVASESLPYLVSGASRSAPTGTASLYTNFTHDPLHRVVEVANAVGETTNEYDQWKTTTTDPNGEIKEYQKDAYGNLSSVVEHNGGSSYTTSYTWDLNDNLTKITDALGNVRNFTYDGLNRRLTAEDLHASADGTYGSWVYAYDDSGNIATTTDPNGQVIVRTYDKLNRLLTEDFTGLAGIEVALTYDTCADGTSRLCSASTTAAVTNYAYSPTGLLESATTTIAGTATPFATHYEYDRQGNQTRIIYPDASEVRYVYNAGGLLETVEQKESGGAFAYLVADLDYAPTGQVTFKKFGNGVESTYTYDSAGLYRLTRIYTTRPEIGGGFGGNGDASLPTDLSSDLTTVESFPAISEVLPEEVILPEEVDLTSAELAIDPGSTPTVLQDVASSTSEMLQEETTPTSTEPIIVESELVPNDPQETASSTTILEADVATTSIFVAPLEVPEVPSEQIASTTENGFPIPFSERLKLFPADAEELRLKAPIEQHLGRREVDGIVKYAYKTDIRMDSLPVDAKTRIAAESAGYLLGEEVVDERTRHSRTFNTDQEDVYVTEIVAGDPQYYEDKNGEWWVVHYGVTTERSYEEQVHPKKNLMETVIEQVVSAVTSVGKRLGLVAERAYAATSTFYPDPNPESATMDAHILKDDSTSWNETRNATVAPLVWDAGEECGVGAALGTGWGSNRYYLLRCYLLFDTSSIPDTDGIGSATLDLYITSVSGAGSEKRIYVTSSNPASNTTIIGEDFDQIGSTSFGESDGSYTTGTYESIPLNSTGLSAISKTGISKFGVRAYHDFNDVTPTNTDEMDMGFYAADRAGTSEDPKLVVIHSAAPTAPTGLETEGQTNPTNVSDATPEFSAIFNSAEAGEQATYYQIQVATSTTFSASPIMWNSGKVALSSSTPIGVRSPEISYNGSVLEATVPYHWRIRFWDDTGVSSSWSSGTATFTLTLPDASPTILQDTRFTYDSVGNIIMMSDHSGTFAARVVEFEYDDLHRLTSASTTLASSTPFRETYAYNAIGNLTNKSDLGTYTYSGSGYTNPQAVRSIGSTSLAYDKNGNLLSNGPTAYAWDYANHLVASNSGSATTTYGYDHMSQRVSKSSGAVTTSYPNRLYNTDGTTKTKHVFAGNDLIAAIETTGTTTNVQYVHPDHLSSTNVVTDVVADLAELADYYPFGAERISSGSFDEQRKYIGQEYDEESDLSYLNARYYDGARGQFTSQDPVFWEIGQTPDGKAALSNPQAQNSYSYAGNNPITNKDPSGRFWWVGFYDWSGYEGTSGALMKAGEVLGGHQRGMDAIRTNQSTINSASSKYGVDPALTRAIIMEEQSHLLPGEGVKDAMFPDSQLAGYDGGVGVMQVSGRVGKDFGGYSKAELARNPSKNIDSGTAYLGNISSSRNTTNPATIGTAYNGASAYGLRIQSQMNNPNYNTNVVVYGLQKLVKSLNSYVKSLKK